MLRNEGILLKTENFAGKLHAKTIIIDDEYLISGSMNFSNSGENKNDENLLIIKNSKIAKLHKGFFLYLWTIIPNKYLKYNAKPESKDSIGSCSDGVDNNFNGKIDKEEELCK
jgi:phosphatidylserine/phosphatidylglycerophosphate/cardiolipin synthase-like enzyme